jgi:hypothetical protein
MTRQARGQEARTLGCFASRRPERDLHEARSRSAVRAPGHRCQGAPRCQPIGTRRNAWARWIVLTETWPFALAARRATNQISPRRRSSPGGTCRSSLRPLPSAGRDPSSDRPGHDPAAGHSCFAREYRNARPKMKATKPVAPMANSVPPWHPEPAQGQHQALAEAAHLNSVFQNSQLTVAGHGPHRAGGRGRWIPKRAISGRPSRSPRK